MLDGLEKFTYVSSLLSNEEMEQLQLILLNNIDVFAWSHSDMVGINPTVASHKLNIIPAARPIRQKVRRFHPTCHQIIQTKVDNLMRASFIREVKYREWLANMVVVPKKCSNWRVCVDYTNLNESCPKDRFPLPRIDQIIDVVARHGTLSFLDAFSGYHQILMHPPDAEKTAFITLHGLYCYIVMHFGLKNVRATYQRLVTKIFRPLLGETMEVYIDYMLVKSKKRFDHTKHLQEAFELLRKYSMKLNPLKCAFRVSSGKFLGFMVTQRSIEANPFQLKAIMDSHIPTSRKGRCVGNSSCIPPNKRNGIPLYLSTNQVNEIDEACSSWMTPIVHYLNSRELPNNRIEAHKIQVQTVRFFLMNGQLYKWSLDKSYLKCLTSQQGQYILVEL